MIFFRFLLTEKHFRNTKKILGSLKGRFSQGFLSAQNPKLNQLYMIKIRGKAVIMPPAWSRKTTTPNIDKSRQH